MHAIASRCNSPPTRKKRITIDPNPIPGGNEFLGDGTIYHVELPGFPPLGSPDPATNDPSVITDFSGHIGLAYVDGTGTHTDKTTGAVATLPFEVDLRFMTGDYVGVNGKKCWIRQLRRGNVRR